MTVQDDKPGSRTTVDALIGQLNDLVKRWNTYEDIPKSQQSECRVIGTKLCGLGGEELMRIAYYTATGYNRAAHIIAAYWDGVGEWRW